MTVLFNEICFLPLEDRICCGKRLQTINDIHSHLPSHLVNYKAWKEGKPVDVSTLALIFV